MKEQTIVVWRSSVVVLLALIASTAASALPAHAQSSYQHPVDAPVVDGFRPPTSFAGAGNRGYEYGTVGGEQVRSAKAGTVAFAGPIGANRYVSIDHADGLRTTYSNLEAVLVRSGDVVDVSAPIAVAGPGFHFGVRRGRIYLDPGSVLSAGSSAAPGEVLLSVRLVDAEPGGREANARFPSSREPVARFGGFDLAAWLAGR